MINKLKETIKEELGKLPKETQNAINAVDWVNTVEQIGKKHSLSENELNNLQVEILLILIGLSDNEDCAINIEKEVGIIKDTAKKISIEVNEEVFAPMYDILTESIKKNLIGKKINPEQNLNFILSGGDYSAFMEGGDAENDKPVDTQRRNLLDLKSK